MGLNEIYLSLFNIAMENYGNMFYLPIKMVIIRRLNPQRVPNNASIFLFTYGGFHRGYPYVWIVHNGKTYKWDDLGYPRFRKPPYVVRVGFLQSYFGGRNNV